MRTMILIAAAGLTGLVAVAPPARAQYYGWGYYRPYYPVPYGYYPAPYYAPPPYYTSPRFDPSPRRFQPVPVARKARHHVVPRQYHIVHRSLVNPLLGPLPGATSPRGY